jgi:dTDP-glucose 4,6-dehydratase
VVPNFIMQALKGEPLTVYGQGEQTRSFQYVDDLVVGLKKLLDADHHLPVNIGNPHEMTVLEFAKKIIELTGSKSSIVYKPLPEDDPQVRQPDITKAKKILGWEPKVQLEEGLVKTIEYFRARLGEQKT